MDISKAFDILNYGFLIDFKRKFGLGQNFINWIKALLKDQKS